MNYANYTVEAFVLDARFRKWVLDPDPEAQAFWEDWMRDNPQMVETLQQARQLLLSIPEVKYSYRQESQNALFTRITEEIQTPNQHKSKVVSLPPREGKPASRTDWPWRLLNSRKVAASLLILLTLGTVYFLSRWEATSPPQFREWVVKKNPNGQRSTIFLSDGTEVLLNAGSQLNYYEQFSDSERRVVLSGEAFFMVARDTLRPFRVITDNIVTQALGTSFNVKAFPDQAIQVALVSGKVMVSDSSHAESGVILLPGESAAYDSKEPGALAKSRFDEKQVLSWKEGTLYFQDADEQTVITTLERWYGVNITLLNPSPVSWEYTGEIKAMSLAQLLQSLSYTMHFDYTVDHNQVTLKYHE